MLHGRTKSSAFFVSSSSSSFDIGYKLKGLPRNGMYFSLLPSSIPASNNNRQRKQTISPSTNMVHSTSTTSSINPRSLLSRIATGDGHSEDNPYFDGWKAYEDDPFHLTKNPDGVIQMGLAENQLCFDLVEEWMRKHPESSICSAEGVAEFRDTAIFQDYHGLPKFRKGVAMFMEEVRGNKVKFDPDRIVMSGGATGAHETMAFCLADPGDAFLVPTPYYPGFDRDLRWRTGVQIVPIACHSRNNFRITEQAVEAAYAKAKAANITVKAVLITNPSNPLGTTIEKSTMRMLVRFVGRHRIHLISDEIYAATVFHAEKYTSVGEIVEEGWCERELIHIVYSLSKDMGFPGLRVGIIYSYNEEVVRCSRRMSSFGLVSSQTQHMLGEMLGDGGFVRRMVGEGRRRLERRSGAMRRGLGKMGIRCGESEAGLFLWMDLRWMMGAEQTVEEEVGLWRKVVGEVKLNVSPGSSFHCGEPGWFRVCIANMDEETVKVALGRIRGFVGVMKVGGKRRCGRQSDLQLSLSFRRNEVVAAALSVSSPIPQSPRLQATN